MFTKLSFKIAVFISAALFVLFGCGSPTQVDDIPNVPIVQEKFIQTCVGGCSVQTPLSKVAANLIYNGSIETRPDTITIKSPTRTTLEIINRSDKDLYIRSITITNENDFTETKWTESSTWGTIDSNRPLTLVPNNPRDNQILVDFDWYKNQNLINLHFSPPPDEVHSENITSITYNFTYFDDEGLEVEVTEVDTIIIKPQYVVVEGDYLYHITDSAYLDLCLSYSVEFINMVDFESQYVEHFNLVHPELSIFGSNRLDSYIYYDEPNQSEIREQNIRFNETVIEYNDSLTLPKHHMIYTSPVRDHIHEYLVVTKYSNDPKYSYCRSNYNGYLSQEELDVILGQ